MHNFSELLGSSIFPTFDKTINENIFWIKIDLRRTLNNCWAMKSLKKTQNEADDKMWWTLYRSDCHLLLNVSRDFTRYPLNHMLRMSKKTVSRKVSRFLYVSFQYIQRKSLMPIFHCAPHLKTSFARRWNSMSDPTTSNSPYTAFERIYSTFNKNYISKIKHCTRWKLFSQGKPKCKERGIPRSTVYTTVESFPSKMGDIFWHR